MDVIVSLENIPWEEIGRGVRAKIQRRGAQQVRLVEFSEGFAETEWCTAGHSGQVLEGEFTLRTRDGDQRLRAGDLIVIPAGNAWAHVPVLAPGERVRLLLFENV